MLFWIFVILLIVGIGCVIVANKDWGYNKHHFLWQHDADIELAGGIISIVSAVVLVFMLVFMLCKYVTVDAYVSANKECYNALTYKLESGACVDEFGLLSKSVIDEIQEWNEDVAYYQSMQDNFWVGIFYPNVYDQFETIEYKNYSINKGLGDTE